MRISNIGSLNQVQHIYLYSNSNYNQAPLSSVSPVKPVNSLKKIDEQEDSLKYAVTYQHENTKTEARESNIVTKEKENLMSEYANQDSVQYNSSNPYELSRMSIENSLLAGMNFDMLA